MSRLAYVYWLGGAPCSGKSTIAAKLAQRHGLSWYCCDDHLADHAHRADPARQPELARVGALAWDAFFARSVPELLEDECRIYAQEFAFILNDLHALGDDRPILAEGAALMPSLVADRAAPGQALWLLPSAAFQWQTYPQRGAWVVELLAQCRASEQAFERWMARDVAFAQRVATQARALALPYLWITGERSLDEVEALVEAQFGLSHRKP